LSGPVGVTLGMGATVTVNDLLDGHVVLDLESLDRIYLNGYVPSLQVGGQVVSFMTRHLGLPISSPAVLEKIGTKFRRRVDSFARANEIPVVKFHRGDRKVEVMRRYLDARARTGRSGVAAIGVAQEYQNVFAANERDRSTGVPWFSFTKADRRRRALPTLAGPATAGAGQGRLHRRVLVGAVDASD